MVLQVGAPFVQAGCRFFSVNFVPPTDVSVDEMIVRFSGRSMHTVKMRCKPTPQGYKIFAFCDAGYSFLYYSRADSIVGVTLIRGLSPTSSAVAHLTRTLPHSSYRFNIYMDNYFSNISLFKHPRGLQIGACGTVRPSSKEYPRCLKVEKSDRCLWNTFSVVDQAVLAIVWIAILLWK